MTTLAPDPAGTGLDPVADLVRRRRPGHSLEAPFYRDPDVFARDLDVIFSRHWIFVAVEAEIPEPGDFVRVDLGAASVIVLRDDDEQVRALRNVCRHRGARLLDEPRGSVGTIVCGYHQWTYGTDGRLLFAKDQAPDFDKGCYSLLQVAVRSQAGLIFVCLSPDPPTDFAEHAALIEPYLRAHDLTHTKVAAQVDLIERANWKLVMENNRECYHCEAGHPELTCTFFPTYGYAPEDVPDRLLPAHARYLRAEADLEAACVERGLPFALLQQLTGTPSGFRIQREALDGAGESYTIDGKAAVRRLLADLDTPRLGRLSLHHQPNMWSHFQADHAVVFSALPLAPDRTLVRTTWLVHEDAVEGEDYDVEHLTTVWRMTNEQDAGLCALAQAGVEDPAYLPGPYSRSEADVEAFVAWYIERLREAG